LKCSRQAMISVGNDASRMLKKATFSPAQPWRAKTRLVSSKAAASYHFIWGGWDDSNCARRSHPPTHWHAETCHLPGRGPSDSPTSPEGAGRLFFTARIERPPLYRGGSASKKNGLPAPSHHSEGMRSGSKEGLIDLPLRALSRPSTSISKAGWSILDCTQPSHPPTPSAPRRALAPGEHIPPVRVQRGSFDSLPLQIQRGVAQVALDCAHRTSTF